VMIDTFSNTLVLLVDFVMLKDAGCAKTANRPQHGTE